MKTDEPTSRRASVAALLSMVMIFCLGFLVSLPAAEPEANLKRKPIVLVAGDSEAARLALMLDQSMGRDVAIRFNGAAVPQSLAQASAVEQRSIASVMTDLPVWLRQEQPDAVLLMVGAADIKGAASEPAAAALMNQMISQVGTIIDRVPVFGVLDPFPVKELKRDGFDKSYVKRNIAAREALIAATKAEDIWRIGTDHGRRSLLRRYDHDEYPFVSEEGLALVAREWVVPPLRERLVAAGRWQFNFRRGMDGQHPQDRVFYVGGPGVTRFDTVHQLSDGRVLLAGATSSLDWVPKEIPRHQLSGPRPTGKASEAYPFMLVCDASLERIERVVHLPKGAAAGIDTIRDTAIPGQPTGVLYIGGKRLGDKDEKIRPGFFIARLDANFVNGIPKEMEWVHNVWNSGVHAWDVNSRGEAVFVEGGPHGWDWYEVQAIGADGKRMVIEHWRHHWYADAEGKRQVHHGLASTCPGDIWYSGFIFKDAYGQGTFRSWNREDFLHESSDGNGGVKIGRWPFDAMFPGYFDVEQGEQVMVLEGVWDTRKQQTVPAQKDRKGNLQVRKHGYYGYKMADLSCEINAIVFDRRDDRLYLGGCNKSHMGQPDFEPWVMAFSSDGQLRWWQRLYAESKGISTPDQYIDELLIDYNQPITAGALVVAARAHGNNVNNFFRPSELVHPLSSGKGFQDQFTGNHGNMHFRWLGRLNLDGEIIDATYFAEYAEQDPGKHGDGRFADPLIDHWPHWTSGWPDLNTTGIAPNSLSLMADGSLALAGIGRRPITTKNAYMEMPSPVADRGSIGYWSNFMRVYTPDLGDLRYSSILAGPWDWYTGHGHSDVRLTDTWALDGQRVIITGYAPVHKETGEPYGNAMPVANQPDWAARQRQGVMGVLGLLHIGQ